jgi:hypothetical protein
MLQLEVVGLVVGALFGDQGPEGSGMVELLEVAEFVDDEVVLGGRREEDDTVAEVQIALARAAAPAGFLIADGDPAVGKAVVGIKMFQSFMDQCAGRFTIFFIEGIL